jgi:hypothetical protein
MTSRRTGTAALLAASTLLAGCGPASSAAPPAASPPPSVTPSGPPSGPSAATPSGPSAATPSGSSAGTPSGPSPATPSGPSAGTSGAPSSATGWVEPRTYRYTLTTGCTRGFYEARYRVSVAGGVVVSSEPLNEQATAHRDFVAPTLAEIDTWITSSEPANTGIRRERDPVDGHPVAFGFDQKAMAYDGGVCFAVSDYRR